MTRPKLKNIQPDVQKLAITLKQLRALAAAVETGSLTVAGQRLNVTTSAISTQLKLLEENLGGKLLGRANDGHMVATEAGRAMFDAALQIEEVLAHALGKAAAIFEGRLGLVTIGAVSAAKYFVPKLVRQLRQDAPAIKTTLQIGNRRDIVAALATRKLDLAIMGRPPREPKVEAFALGDHPHLLVAPPDHPLAGRGAVPDDELLNEVFLIREPGSGTRALTDRFLERLDPSGPAEMLEFGSNGSIKEAAMAGLGLAVISAHAIQIELEQRRLVELQVAGFPVVRQWFLVYREGVLPAVAQRVCDIILAMNGSFLPGAADDTPPSQGEQVSLRGAEE